MRQNHGGRGGRDACHAMMLGGPVAVEADRLGMDGQVGGVGQRLGHGAALDDGHQIEQGITCHGNKMGTTCRPASQDRVSEGQAILHRHAPLGR